MRYLVISDIHGNLEALEAVLAAAPLAAGDRLLVLGDLVGYGADPNAVVDRIRALDPFAIIRGNHDKVAAGIEEPDGFNPVARAVVTWTRDQLSPANTAWLGALPRGPIQVDALLDICHGTPLDEDAYVLDELDAHKALRATQGVVCLFGHTHFPVIYRARGRQIERVVPDADGVVGIEDGFKYLANPGAVGQPRDGDPRAACAIVDTDRREMRFVRAKYAVEAAQARVIEAGLPEMLAARLALGR
jgi:predicted phosphodiesterase